MKKRFRGEVLRMLAVRHGQQQSRMDDVALCHALRSLAWEVDLNDVVTILQEMQGRNWVKFRQLRSIYNRRVELSQIEILPDGQDLYDQTTQNPAVEF
ncbi:MAG: hypothetical protein ABT07_01365 [Microbacterium sp. SCN 70-10]|nr:MAG: hypothetical protein ABT07_01365 [Microbacterium sp. SCN 70-10]